MYMDDIPKAFSSNPLNGNVRRSDCMFLMLGLSEVSAQLYVIT